MDTAPLLSYELISAEEHTNFMELALVLFAPPIPEIISRRLQYQQYFHPLHITQSDQVTAVRLYPQTQQVLGQFLAVDTSPNPTISFNIAGAFTLVSPHPESHILVEYQHPIQGRTISFSKALNWLILASSLGRHQNLELFAFYQPKTGVFS